MNEDLKELSNYKYEEESEDNSLTSNSDDDNEIEEEIDIYLNNINENNLNNINTYLIQYPLRPKYRPYNYTNNIQKIYTCKNYNKLKQIKNKGNTNEETYVFEYKLHEYMKEETHESNSVYKDVENDKNISRLISTSVSCEYISNCVGVFQYNEIKKKKEIYMIPLKHIYQFKPYHDNLKLDVNEEEKNKPDELIQGNNLNENVEASESKKHASDANPPPNNVDHTWTSIVNIYEPDSFEAHEMLELFTNLSIKNDILNCRNDASGNTGMEIYTGSYNNFDLMSNSEDTKTNMNSRGEKPNEKSLEIQFNNDGYLYLNHLCKKAKEDNSSHLPSDGNVKDRKSKDGNKNSNNLHKNDDDVCTNLNMLYFFSLNLDEQILTIMRLKNVQRFNEIQKIIKKNIDYEILLNTIQKYCVNVLGLWIIKSKYLYKFLKGKEKKSEDEKKKNLENFSHVDYKIRVRDLLLVIIFKQVEPILLKHLYELRVGKKGSDDARNKRENDNHSDSDNNNNFIRTRDEEGADSKKINSSTSILMENFEKATNLPNNTLTEMFAPLCEYKYTGYFFKHKMDEEFVNNNTKLCLLNNEKWKKKMVKIAKIIQTYKSSKIIINDYKLDIRTLEKNITDLLYNNCMSFDDIYNKIKKESKNTNVDLPVFVQALKNIALHINNMWFLRIDNQSEFNKCRNAVINIFQKNHNSVFSKNEIIQLVEMNIQCPLTIPDIYFRNILKEFCVHINGKYMFKGNDQFKEERCD
ncbi:hypothetical protein, conserved [Plasmodium gonderi]|uniref:DNA-directed RNA polymerase III subunit RPC5 n=1 Tax=Plasmodium gonderi TaxID=77519 RepID=A0A1Y1JLK6_PLAGO|nr:hypothetical protein, conserved [Plasmodium gonderi]GAW82498.1 hypothetical protein, conserved [Plasmodium gonderi]